MKGVLMSNVDPELWALVHGGIHSMGSWPDEYMWTAARAGMRFLLEALRVLDDPGVTLTEEEKTQQQTALRSIETGLSAPTFAQADENLLIDAIVRIRPGDPIWYRTGIPRDVPAHLLRTAFNRLRGEAPEAHWFDSLRRAFPLQARGLPPDRFIDLFVEEFTKAHHA